MKRLLPAFWERKGGMRPGGIFHDDPAQVFVVVRVDEGPSDTWSHSIVFHEYVHFLVERQLDYLPLWLNEGLAEYYGTCSVEKERVIVGRAAPWNLQLLQERAPLPVETSVPRSLVSTPIGSLRRPGQTSSALGRWKSGR